MFQIRTLQKHISIFVSYNVWYLPHWSHEAIMYASPFFKNFGQAKQAENHSAEPLSSWLRVMHCVKAVFLFIPCYYALRQGRVAAAQTGCWCPILNGSNCFHEENSIALLLQTLCRQTVSCFSAACYVAWRADYIIYTYFI